jgi:hypothetical protein
MGRRENSKRVVLTELAMYSMVLFLKSVLRKQSNDSSVTFNGLLCELTNNIR